MTNHNWAFSVSEMRESLEFDCLEIINDFTAVSIAIPMLKADDLIQFGGNQPDFKKPAVVLGAGTGLGVAHLIKVDKQWVALPGEGGHVDFAANSDEEDEILAILRAEKGHVSAERVLSGAGLVNLYHAIVKSDNREPLDLQPEEITHRACENSCLDCRRALSLFCVILGHFCGNLALTMATFGGVYIAAGIVPRFLKYFESSGFRAAFEDKGRLRDYLQSVPVFLITHHQPGLLRAGAHIRQVLGRVL